MTAWHCACCCGGGGLYADVPLGRPLFWGGAHHAHAHRGGLPAPLQASKTPDAVITGARHGNLYTLVRAKARRHEGLLRCAGPFPSLAPWSPLPALSRAATPAPPHRIGRQPGSSSPPRPYNHAVLHLTPQPCIRMLVLLHVPRPHPHRHRPHPAARCAPCARRPSPPPPPHPQNTPSPPPRNPAPPWCGPPRQVCIDPDAPSPENPIRAEW